ncbi:MAG: hypothetical protein GF329_20815 [Candidatus Lokiarchaeota archaeon]|nr:hypothetical protein [Candidatus Lokiarchaeota archaeon]
MNSKFNYRLKSLIIVFFIFTMLFLVIFIPIINSNKKFTNYDSEAIILTPLDDSTAPIISFLQNHPSTPQWFDDINITVEVNDDDSGIKRVILSYSSQLDEYGGYRNFTMTHLRDDTFNYTIPNSIYVSNNGFGDTVTYKVYACDQAGNWKVSPINTYYMNDTINPEAIIYYPSNNSWVSSLAKFNTTAFDNGSGIDCVNLTIYNQSGSKIESFESTEPSNVFEWDTSTLANYNSSNPQFYIVNYTVRDKSTPQNINRSQIFIFIDKESPFISDINRLPCEDNATITNEIIKGTAVHGSVSSTYFNDSNNYFEIINYTDGLILMPLSINLSDYGIVYDLISSINISISARVSYSGNNTIEQAGWGIYNWSDESIFVIDNTIFNQTNDQFDNFLINNQNISSFISQGNNSRLEAFVLLNTTQTSTSFLINYLNFHILYDNNHWFSGNNFTISVWGNDSISFDKIKVHHTNITLAEINNSYISSCTINTNLLPEGKNVDINVTTYDKAGNTLYDTLTIKNDITGPDVEILSPIANYTFGESGIWNTIIPITISGSEQYSKFNRMELYINGVLQDVNEGQLGQIIETNATGQIIYRQTNSTWYKPGTYDFYWNASECIENKTYNIKLIGYDSLNNKNYFQLNATKKIFVENISIEITKPNTIVEETPFILRTTIKNYGNSTLFNYTPGLKLPSSWSYTFYNYTPNNFLYLNPNDQQEVYFKVTTSGLSRPKNYNITVSINCQIVENFTQSVNNFSTSQEITITVNDKPLYSFFENFVPLLIAIFGGIGLGVVGVLIYYKSKEVK